MAAYLQIQGPYQRPLVSVPGHKKIYHSNVLHHPYFNPPAVILPPRQPLRKDPPYQARSAEEERKIQQKSNAGHYCQLLLAEELDSYLIMKGKVMPHLCFDYKSHLSILANELSINPWFLATQLSPSSLLYVKWARNAFEHNNWALIDLHSDQYLKAMTELADSLGKPKTANEIQEIGNAIRAGDCSGGVKFKPFTFSNTGYTRAAGFGLCIITDAVVEKIFIKIVWEFLQSQRPVGSIPPSVDLYYNVADMTNQQSSNPHYLGRRGTVVLAMLKQMRLDLAHGAYETLFNNFVTYYENMEEFLRLIRKRRNAEEVRIVRKILVILKRTGQQVKPCHFPELF